MSKSQIPAEESLHSLIHTLGGPEELLALLDDYRKIVGGLATASDARMVMPNVRCWFSKKQLLRIAMHLPDEKSAAFLGV